ncbi:hypothetical protein [Helicobacter trogontum]|nr:hypothetical protein [Helicobacter trogontum]
MAISQYSLKHYRIYITLFNLLLIQPPPPLINYNLECYKHCTISIM